jgi:hypothetical protein
MGGKKHSGSRLNTNSACASLIYRGTSMASLLFFADSPRAGCGATVKLESGETCLLSIALTSIRLKKGRFGVGRLLYKEKVSYRAALTAQILGFLFPDSLLPAEFPSNPVLRAFTNAILHCRSCVEVNAMLKTVSDYPEQQAEHDNQVITDFAARMAHDELKTALYHDIAVLPHPKETILRAIEREILREQLAARVEWLKKGAYFLQFFQRDRIGLAAANVLMTVKAEGDYAAAAARITSSADDAESLLATVKAEGDQIAARIEAAVRLRNARKPWPPRRGA